jgi:chorismate mutase
MPDKLPGFRRELDEVDEQILEILSRRMNICREVAQYKSEADIPMMQADRIALVKLLLRSCWIREAKAPVVGVFVNGHCIESSA